MRVGLIYPRALNLTFPPLGVLYIASVLKKDGHDVRVYEIDNENVNLIFEKISHFSPGLVGLSITSATQIDLSEVIINKARSLLPESKIICGGVCATVFYELFLNKFAVDAVVRGEGEDTAIELVRNIEENRSLAGVKGIIYKDNGKIIENPMRPPVANLDDIPFPARDIVDFNRYLKPPGLIRGVWLKRSTSIMTSRGCPAHCIYCGSHMIFGRTTRRRSVENVLAEIRDLYRDYKIDGIWFADDTFTLDKNWVIDFCQKLKKEDFNIKWGCQARVNTVDEQMLDEMKRAGCLQLDFGVESGSLEVLKALKKGTNPEMIKKAFSLTKKAGIRTLATFMVGNPGETSRDIQMTSRLSKAINADFTIFFFTTAYPGTELFEMSLKNNWLKNKDYSKYFVRENPALEINFKQKELILIRARLQNAFMMRNIFSSIRSPEFLLKMLYFMCVNYAALIGALKITLRTKNFDDFTFNFIEQAGRRTLAKTVS